MTSNTPPQQVALENLVLKIGIEHIEVRTALHCNDMPKDEINLFLKCVTDLQAENIRLKDAWLDKSAEVQKQYERAEAAEKRCSELDAGAFATGESQ